MLEYLTLAIILFTHLDALVTGARCHALAIEVIGHIVDDVLVICGNILGNKHSLASSVQVKGQIQCRGERSN